MTRIGPYDVKPGPVRKLRGRRDAHGHIRFTEAATDTGAAKALRRARVAAGMTQQELASLIAVKRSRLAKWEQAHRSIPAESWRALRRILPDLPEGREVWGASNQPYKLIRVEFDELPSRHGGVS